METDNSDQRFSNIPPVVHTSSPKGKLLIFLSFVFLLLIVGVGAYYFWPKPGQTEKEENKVPPSEKILYEQSASWGLCRVGGTCFRTTTLYISGRLVVTGDKNSEKVLSKSLVDQIVAEIKKTNIMNKSCESKEFVLDSSVSWKIYLDGQEKTILNPGCETELESIEQLFNRL
ncbi:MAG: hypothetical protein M1150_03645 [Patescibacteria group bacterium]|nr:hypothetical protein [Patescibacteria group bacterium]